MGNKEEKIKLVLEDFYKVVKELMPDKDVYYSKEEIEKLKKDKNSIFL